MNMLWGKDRCENKRQEQTKGVEKGYGRGLMAKRGAGSGGPSVPCPPSTCCRVIGVARGTSSVPQSVAHVVGRTASVSERALPGRAGHAAPCPRTSVSTSPPAPATSERPPVGSEDASRGSGREARNEGEG